MTLLLFSVNIVAYVYVGSVGGSLTDPAVFDLLNAGANFDGMTLGGDWWRLVASNILHGGPIHLLMNMGGLIALGWFLERIIGPWRILMAYLVCSIGSGLASVWWNHFTVSVGASGAIFGLLGVAVPRHPAYQIAKSSNRPRAPGGFVS